MLGKGILLKKEEPTGNFNKHNRYNTQEKVSTRMEKLWKQTRGF